MPFRFDNPKTFKLVIGLKVSLLVGIIIAINDTGDWLYIGDRSAPAAETEQKSDKEEKPAKPAKGRKSFLANLLDLPPLDTESIKKEELGRYLDLAERKKAQIDQRIAQLEKRESQLIKLEQSVDQKLKALDDERRYFADTIQREKVLKGERVEKLKKMYAKMEPKKAGPVFEEMDKDLVVELFKDLPQKQVTRILEVMDAKKSVELTEYFGRVRSAREYDILKEMNTSLRKEFEDCKGL